MNAFHASAHPSSNATALEFEWPTWTLWLAILVGWFALIHWSARLSLWLSTPLMVLVLAWYLSFQHELTHGHPTRSAATNRLIGLLPLAIWYPFDTYKVDHLKHHEDAHLTEPGVDTESNYITPEQAASLGPVAMWLYRSQRTFLGRFAIGPAVVIVSLLTKTWREVAHGNVGALKVWAVHLPLVALLLWGVDSFGDISPWRYCFGMAYPALGLVMLRSLYEHRPGALPAHRTVINEAGIFWRLLFLNNNYHAVHHAYPELQWYRIPAAYASDRDGYRARNGGFVLQGYGTLMRQFAWAPVDNHVLPDPLVLPSTRRTSIKATPASKR
jgi:fatty acid desaturase